ncbi:phosphoglycerate mutase [Sorangium cellulosum]|uniref:Phosphoglycerate mutase n=1 Tax=Sorangium cellulosum TaxID=56 RepID=A0A4V0NE02_SORCE|nr:histidine phosphatase family protein [Sorangium cellulosum]AUX24462.1 phosphoglycerate mutase [Sorangium cellulosum]
MRATTKLILIRHGETEDNRAQVFQGQGGRGLNARGRDQAARLAARLAGARIRLAGVYCSDLDRARETAEIVASTLGLRAIADPELREVHLGGWQGLSHAEVQARYPDEWAAWRRGDDIRRGGGETYAELGDRMTRALDGIAERHAGEAVGVVSHGAAIKSVIGRVLRIGAGGLRAFQVPANTGVCLVERDGERRYRLVVWNDAAHLGDALAEALAAPLA